MKTALAALLAIHLIPVIVRADLHTPQIKAAAERTNKALIAGDYATVADLTTPKLVQLLGGRSELIAMMQATVAHMKAQGVLFKSAAIGNPTDVLANKTGQLFAIVPFSLSVSVPQGIATQKSFLIANSIDRGRTWKFVDGGNVEPATLGQVFPDLPAALKLPAKEPPVLQKAASPSPAASVSGAPAQVRRSTNAVPAKPSGGTTTAAKRSS